MKDFFENVYMDNILSSLREIKSLKKNYEKKYDQYHKKVIIRENIPEDFEVQTKTLN